MSTKYQKRVIFKQAMIICRMDIFGGAIRAATKTIVATEKRSLEYYTEPHLRILKKCIANNIIPKSKILEACIQLCSLSHLPRYLCIT